MPVPIVSASPNPQLPGQSPLADGSLSRVALLGEALIDHFPDADVIGGAPFNVARNLAALGVSPLLITRIGDDADARLLLNDFSRFSLSQSGVQHDATRPTGNVRITRSGGQHVFHIGKDQAWDAIDAGAAKAAVAAFEPGAICFGTLAQRQATSRAAIRGVVEAATCLRVLDLNLRDDDNEALSAWSLAHADIVKVNDSELDQLLSWFVLHGATVPTWGTAAHQEAMCALFARFAVKRWVVTRGAEGYAAFDASGALIAEGAAPRVQVVDTVGAGDAFLAVMLLGNLKHWPVADTLARASQFAADVCTLRGAVSNDMDFYRRWHRRFATVADVAAGFTT